MGKTAIDLFCGIGGFSLGLEKANYEVKCGIDKEEDIIEVYNENFDHPGFIYDLTNSPNEFFNHRPKKNEVDLVVGGPPCQGFSTANYKRDSEDDRNNLIMSFLDWVDYIQPKAFIMENVPGILSIDNGETPKEFKEASEDLGYDCEYRKLKASYYDVPQARKRVFFVATSDSSNYTWPNKSKEEMACGNVFNFPNIGNYPDHESPNHQSVTIERIKAVSQGNDWKDIPEEKQTQAMKDGTKHGCAYYRIDPDEPSPTIANLSKFIMIHPEEDRAVSAREAMSLQTLPTDYEIGNKSLSFKYQVIANMVPCNLAYNVVEGFEFD